MYGERLKELRKSRNLSQDKLAELLNISQRQVSHWEREQFDMPINVIIEIVKFFNVSSDYLLGLTDSDSKRILSEDEEDLIENFRGCDREGKIKAMSCAIDERRRTVAAASQESAAQ